MCDEVERVRSLASIVYVVLGVLVAIHRVHGGSRSAQFWGCLGGSMSTVSGERPTPETRRNRPDAVDFHALRGGSRSALLVPRISGRRSAERVSASVGAAVGRL